MEDTYIQEVYYSSLVQLSNNIFSNIEAYIQNGANHVEVFMDGPQWGNLSLSKKEIAEKLLNYPLPYSLHGPMFDLNLASFYPEIRAITIKKLQESIDFTTLIDARHVIISPAHLAVSSFDEKQAVQFFKEGLQQLISYTKTKSVTLLIENSGTGGKELFDADEFVELAKYIYENYENSAAIVLDTGHAHLNGWNIPDVIKI